MIVTLSSGEPAKARVDLLVFPLFEGELASRRQPNPGLARVDRRLKGLLAALGAQEGFKGRVEQSFQLHTQSRLPTARVMLVGLGAQSRFTPEVLRLALGRAVKAAHRVKARSLAVQMPAVPELEPALKAAVEGMVLGAYRYERWRTVHRDGPAPVVDRVQLLLPEGVQASPDLAEALALGQQVAEATNWARDLVNEPAGTMTPGILAEEAKRMATTAGLAITVLDRKQIAELKLGMFLAVARGSDEEPKLIRLSWVPQEPAAARAPSVCLVGKAITFDSGGLSLKPSDGMLDMKTDMAGSAAVLGAMRVVAQLKPPFPVHALMGACENMPSGRAYRLGDVLVSRLGKTVEITNTDAEGRLVLGDMLTLATELKPALIVDVATLTGACIVALGNYVTGALGDDDALMYEVLESARVAGEDLWRLPLSEHQKDALKSEVADLKNAGERAAGAINAAIFLKEFVGKTPWVHLDIAGPSQSPKERGYHAKGATGVGVRTLVELVRRRTALLAQPRAAPVAPRPRRRAASSR
jgi:leucyl aminopeptidase